MPRFVTACPACGRYAEAKTGFFTQKKPACACGIAAGKCNTVGLKSNGTVAAVGSNAFGRCDVSSWTDIRLPE